MLFKLLNNCGQCKNDSYSISVNTSAELYPQNCKGFIEFTADYKCDTAQDYFQTTNFIITIIIVTITIMIILQRERECGWRVERQGESEY